MLQPRIKRTNITNPCCNSQLDVPCTNIMVVVSMMTISFCEESVNSKCKVIRITVTYLALAPNSNHYNISGYYCFTGYVYISMLVGNMITFWVGRPSGPDRLPVFDQFESHQCRDENIYVKHLVVFCIMLSKCLLETSSDGAAKTRSCLPFCA